MTTSPTPIPMAEYIRSGRMAEQARLAVQEELARNVAAWKARGFDVFYADDGVLMQALPGGLSRRFVPPPSPST